jgi:hypothetical protein
MNKGPWGAGSLLQLELPVLPAAERQQLLGDYAERSSNREHSPPAEVAWPDALCWTRMHAESGQALDLIIERKEAERRAGKGVFFWGIGNPLGDKVAALLRRVERPQVLFSVMRSRPKHIDAAPTEVLLWTMFVDECGSMRPLPDHVIVVSRGSGRSRTKVAHYALVCQSSQALQLRPCGGLNLSAFRNLGSRNPRVGNSQVTAILERQPSTEFNKYQVDMVASLAPPYFVRLAGPVSLSMDERASLDAAGQLTNGNPQKWTAFARCLREAASARCPGPDLFCSRTV